MQPRRIQPGFQIRQRLFRIRLGGLLDKDGRNPVKQAVFMLPPVLGAMVGNQRIEYGEATLM